MESWFVVYCKPRQESRAEENLLRQGYVVYVPKISLFRRKSGKWLKMVEPLFPRYLFVRFDPDIQSCSPIRSTLGVVSLVRFGGQPATVPEELIAALKEGEGQHQESPFKKGGSVRFLEGPFAGLEGIFDKQEGEDRAIVLLDLLGKINKIKVGLDSISV